MRVGQFRGVCRWADDTQCCSEKAPPEAVCTPDPVLAWAVPPHGAVFKGPPRGPAETSKHRDRVGAELLGDREGAAGEASSQDPSPKQPHPRPRALAILTMCTLAL